MMGTSVPGRASSRPQPAGVLDPAVTNKDAAPLNCDAIEPRLADAIMQALRGCSAGEEFFLFIGGHLKCTCPTARSTSATRRRRQPLCTRTKVWGPIMDHIRFSRQFRPKGCDGQLQI